MIDALEPWRFSPGELVRELGPLEGVPALELELLPPFLWLFFSLGSVAAGLVGAAAAAAVDAVLSAAVEEEAAAGAEDEEALPPLLVLAAAAVTEDKEDMGTTAESEAPAILDLGIHSSYPEFHPR